MIFGATGDLTGRKLAPALFNTMIDGALPEPTAIIGVSRSAMSAEQFAEKLHAYTLPRQGRTNTRVKDLVDMVLLSVSGKLDAIRVRESIAATFRRRATHPVPATLPPPPESWREPFAELASECGMTPDMAPHFAQVAGFLARVL